MAHDSDARKPLDLLGDCCYIGKGQAIMAEKRKFLGVHFKCCNVYARLYANRQRTAYEGGCPRCGKRASIKIGPGGTSNRFFSAQ